MKFQEEQERLSERAAEAKSTGQWGLLDEYCLQILNKLPAVDLANKEENRLRLSASQSLCRAYSDLYKADELIELCQQSLGLATKLNDIEATIFFSGQEGGGYLTLGDPTKALVYLQQALELANKHSKKELSAEILISKAEAYMQVSDFSSALTCSELACSISEELGDMAGNASAQAGLGKIYLHMGDYRQALKAISSTLTFFKESNNTYRVALRTGDLAGVYFYMTDYANALSNYTEALKMYNELGMEVEKTNAFINIGLVHQGLKNYPMAIEYTLQALVNTRQEKRKSIEAIAIENLGEIYMEALEYSKAHEYLTAALELCRELKLDGDIAMIMGNLGSLYSNKNFEGYNTEKAEIYLQQAIFDNEKLNQKKHLYLYLKFLADLYEQQERWKDFAVCYKRFHEVKEEVLNQDATHQAQLIENNRKVEEAERDRQVKLARFQEQEKILHNILPSQIAERILNGEKQIADSCENVSVFFSDIVGFTKLSQTVSPAELVEMLNQVFSEFDRIARKHGLEKIKTIGDAYMAVAGVPEPVQNHAQKTALFALEVMQAMEQYRERTGNLLEIRVGLHSGPAVAGVIGENKFAYDLWGDAVNTASRMESHGEPGRIQVSEHFKKALEGKFILESRGEINVKGKGIMKTYFLTGIKRTNR